MKQPKEIYVINPIDKYNDQRIIDSKKALCPECGAKPGDPCISVLPSKMNGAPMDGVHLDRERKCLAEVPKLGTVTPLLHPHCKLGPDEVKVVMESIVQRDVHGSMQELLVREWQEYPGTGRATQELKRDMLMCYKKFVADGGADSLFNEQFDLMMAKRMEDWEERT